jgi:pilus assembly protein Flp/PilA
MLDLIIRLQIALKTRAEREDGQALVEYALILALVAVAAIATLEAVGTSVNDIFTEISSTLDSALTGS